MVPPNFITSHITTPVSSRWDYFNNNKKKGIHRTYFSLKKNSTIFVIRPCISQTNILYIFQIIQNNIRQLSTPTIMDFHATTITKFHAVVGVLNCWILISSLCGVIPFILKKKRVYVVLNGTYRVTSGTQCLSVLAKILVETLYLRTGKNLNKISLLISVK